MGRVFFLFIYFNKIFYSEIKMMKLLISTLLVLIVSTFAEEELINWTAKEYAPMVLHGDEKVVFSFNANHNLYQFNNKNAYTNCNFNNAVLIEEGPAEVEISGDEETKYFGCSVSSHCSISGQKIELEWHEGNKKIKRKRESNRERESESENESDCKRGKRE